MKNLIINDELKNLLPPLSGDEFAGLEASILKDGCLSPLIVWNNILVDGHYRYEICTKYGIPFSVKSIQLLSLEDAKLWSWRHQEYRRNLTAYHRAELALKLKGIIAAKAKKNQQWKSTPSKDVNECGPIEPRKVLGEMAGVSTGTLAKVEFLMKHADPEVKERLRNGEKGTSINREYCRLKSEITAIPATQTPAITPDLKIILDEETGMMRVRNDVTPEELAAFIVEHFSAEYVRDLIRCLLKWYEQRYGTEATQQILLKNFAEYID